MMIKKMIILKAKEKQELYLRYFEKLECKLLVTETKALEFLNPNRYEFYEIARNLQNIVPIFLILKLVTQRPRGLL